MTLKELSQLYHLNREIEMDQRRLEELRVKASSPSGPNLTGMPGGGNSLDSRLDRYIAEIVDLEAIISAKVTLCIHERSRLERYIADIPDSLTRQIFTFRFVSGLSWEQVAAQIGGYNTAKNLSNICYRYIEKTKDEHLP
jgi:hypothetical protein